MFKDYNDLMNMALIVAMVAHKDQFDKHGVPYIEHPIRVSRNVHSPEAKVIALLHDVIEDTSITPQDLLPYFGENIVARLVILTKTKEDDYIDTYIARIVKDPITTEVKLGDLKDNMDPKRALQDEKSEKRMAKYLRAKQILEAAA